MAIPIYRGNKMSIEIKLLELNKNRMKEIGCLTGEYFLMKDVQQKLGRINNKLDHQYLIHDDKIYIAEQEKNGKFKPVFPVGRIIYKT